MKQESQPKGISQINKKEFILFKDEMDNGQYPSISVLDIYRAKQELMDHNRPEETSTSIPDVVDPVLYRFIDVPPELLSDNQGTKPPDNPLAEVTNG